MDELLVFLYLFLLNLNCNNLFYPLGNFMSGVIPDPGIRSRQWIRFCQILWNIMYYEKTIDNMKTVAMLKMLKGDRNKSAVCLDPRPTLLNCKAHLKMRRHMEMFLKHGHERGQRNTVLLLPWLYTSVLAKDPWKKNWPATGHFAQIRIISLSQVH